MRLVVILNVNPDSSIQTKIIENREYTRNELRDILYKSFSKFIDEIIYKLRINVSNISFILLQMKLKGLVKETSPNFYIRAIRECFE